MIDINHYFYDRLLLKNDKFIDASLFVNYTNKRESSDDENIPQIKSASKKVNPKRNKEDEKTAISVLRYAFDYYLAWPAEYTMDHISVELLKKLKIFDLADRRINYPPELVEPNSPRLYYLVCRMYPEKFTYDSTAAVESFYESRLKSRQREKTLFDGTPEGLSRGSICLMYALRKEGITSAHDAYAKFLSTGLSPWLEKAKLITFCDQNYSHPIEFLHAALPSTEDNEREYAYAKYKMQQKEQKSKLRRLKAQIPLKEEDAR